MIIPGFGALVHSYMPADTIGEDVFTPPAVSLGFNSELKHNDGILADSIKRERKISYNDANKIVSDFSVELEERLKDKKEITIPQVGLFRVSENNKINFSPATDLSANAEQYGFKKVYLPLLINIVPSVAKEEAEDNEDKQTIIPIPLFRRFLTATAVAAIALIFLLFSTPIDNQEIPTQYAGMFSSYNPDLMSFIAANEDVTKEDTVETTTVIQAEIEKEEVKEIVPDVKPISPNGYLIIVASFPTRNGAEKMLSELKEEFNTASIIDRDNRSRIFVRSFENKKDAEYFLNNFRTENPQYKDAWLLSNKVRS